MPYVAGCVITVACGDDNNPSNPTPSANINATFSANHGHELTITSAQITGGNALQLTTTGSTATHIAHRVAFAGEPPDACQPTTCLGGVVERQLSQSHGYVYTHVDRRAPEYADHVKHSRVLGVKAL